MIDNLPEKLRPYAALARLDRPIGIWLLLLPGWWAIVLASGGLFSMHLQGWGIFFLFGVGAVVMRAAGCVINDLWDRKLDAQVARTKNRPLASGAVSVFQASAFLFFLLAVGLLILIQMNALTIILGCLSLPLIVAYPYMKRITWWPQAFLGLTFNFGALMGWSAVTGTLGFAPIFLYVGGIFWTLGYDTIYAHQDIEDDALAGIKSSALRLKGYGKPAVATFYAAAWILFACAGLVGAPYTFAFMLLFAAAAHFAWQIWAWKPGVAPSERHSSLRHASCGVAGSV